MKKLLVPALCALLLGAMVGVPSLSQAEQPAAASAATLQKQLNELQAARADLVRKKYQIKDHAEKLMPTLQAFDQEMKEFKRQCQAEVSAEDYQAQLQYCMTQKPKLEKKHQHYSAQVQKIKVQLEKLSSQIKVLETQEAQVKQKLYAENMKQQLSTRKKE